MKRSLLLFVLGACAGRSFSAEPFDISASPLRIDLQQPAQEPYLPLPRLGMPIFLFETAVERVRAAVFYDVAFRVTNEPVAVWDRVYMGWSNNLPGFKFRDVGPRDIFGEPVGGSTLARATVEDTFPIIEKVRGAVFYDIGFVNRGEYDFSTDNVKRDAGIGVRLDLPIGPVRLDYGIPLSQQEFSGEERWPNLDAPGPGYREPRERFK